MIEAFNILELATLFFALLYFLLILAMSLGWFSLRVYDFSDDKVSTQISVIIAARNEEKNIAKLLLDLVMQNYPGDLFEVIIVDDHSVDRTAEIINDIIRENPQVNFKYHHLDNGSGKKDALAYGISRSEGTLIITTDADCRVGAGWVSTIARFYVKTQAKLISAPVVYHDEQNLFQRFQSLEFLSLIACGAGSIALKKPFMCNGANLAFEREVFDLMDGYKDHEHLASGDDVFLLQQIKSVYGASTIAFLKHKDAVVKTKAVEKLDNFLRQRKRWASKTKAYKDVFAITTALIVFGFNLLLLKLLVFVLIGFMDCEILLIAAAIKLIVDFPILMSVTYFGNQKKLMWYYLPIQLFYPVYISLTAVLSLLSANKWKGRAIR